MTAHQVAELVVGTANFKNAVHPQPPAHNKASAEAMLEHNLDVLVATEMWKDAREGVDEAIDGTAYDMVESGGSVIQVYNTATLRRLAVWDTIAHAAVRARGLVVSDTRHALGAGYVIRASKVSVRVRADHWTPHRRNIGTAGEDEVAAAQATAKRRNRIAMGNGPRPKVTAGDPNSYDHWLGTEVRGRQVQYASTARDLPDQVVAVDGRNLRWRITRVQWVPVPYTDHLHDGKPSGLVVTLGLWTPR